MLKWHIFLLALLGALAFATPSSAWLHPGSPAGVCPYPVDGGCAGANQNSYYLGGISLITAAQQSGQTWINSHPKNANIAAVDYPVGHDKTLTLKDPQSNPPANCIWENAGTRKGPGLFCNSSGSVTIDGYDLTGAISACACAATIEIINQISTSTVTITNNKIPLTSAMSNSSVTLTNGAFAFVFKYNTVDGGVSPSGSSLLVIDDDRQLVSTATSDIEYNAFLRLGALRIVSSPRGGGNRILDNNYIAQLNPVNDGSTHAEPELYAGGATTVIDSVEEKNNLIIWPSFPDGAGAILNTTSFFGSTGNSSVTYSVNHTTIVGNTIITNTKDGTPTGPHMIGYAAALWQWANIGDLNYSDNVVDPTGGTFCTYNGYSSNTDTATVSGNTATVTAGSAVVQVGNIITNGGAWQANVTGIAGSVITFDGPSQSLGSISVSFYPGFTSVTSSGNINPLDGSSLDVSGLRLQPATCFGAHN